jgi:inhibitor of KinA
MHQVRMLKAGEQGVVVEFGDAIDPDANALVHRLAETLMLEMPEHILEMVPTYRSLMIYFDPLTISRDRLQEKIADSIVRLEIPAAGDTIRIITIPVAYGGDFGPDLGFVASHNAISPSEVIAIHTSVPYLVYMLGFTPGFPYLGGMSERIAAPRLKTPRVRIPAGSVGIAGKQTGIYPIESPGGWQLIGRTPLAIFNPSGPTPFLFSAGDYLQFAAIEAVEFSDIENQVASSSYVPSVRCIARAEA